MHSDPYLAAIERIRCGQTTFARFKDYEFTAKVDMRPGASKSRWFVAIARSGSPIAFIKIAGVRGFGGPVLEITHRAAKPGSPVARIVDHYRAAGADITELKPMRLFSTQRSE